MPSLLTSITKGRQEKPLRIGITGPPGVGKSTFALGAPRPLFIDADRRTEHLDVPGRVEPNMSSETPWSDILDTMRELSVQKPAQSGYETIVFDTLDAMEALLHREICIKRNVASLEDVGGWGKGFQLAEAQWHTFFNGLEALRGAGYHVILVVHCELRRFGNPAGEDYDYWAVKLHKKANALFFARVDCLGFATWEDAVDTSGNKAKALTSGKRVLQFGHNPAYQTKKGFALPDKMELDWEKFYGKVRQT